jgi:Protein of unknown function (DUF3224)
MKKIASSLGASTPMRISIVAICMVPLILPAIATQAQTSSTSSSSTKKEPVITLHATGPFEVKIDPQAPDEKAGGAAIGRMLIDKQFHGDLEATSKGAMLAAGTGAKGSSGGYVALEIVTGTLKGRSGTFVLQHSATMNRGVPNLSVTVVPDSGTGQLTGLGGKMNINITDGKHSYDFEYTLPEAP